MYLRNFLVLLKEKLHLITFNRNQVELLNFSSKNINIL